MKQGNKVYLRQSIDYRDQFSCKNCSFLEILVPRMRLRKTLVSSVNMNMATRYIKTTGPFVVSVPMIYNQRRI